MRSLLLSLSLVAAAAPAQVPDPAPPQPFEMAPGVSYDEAIPKLEWGTRISAHRDVEDYLMALQAAAPDRIKVVPYGSTWQGRQSDSACEAGRTLWSIENGTADSSLAPIHSVSGSGRLGSCACRSSSWIDPFTPSPSSHQILSPLTRT